MTANGKMGNESDELIVSFQISKKAIINEVEKMKKNNHVTVTFSGKQNVRDQSSLILKLWKP